MGFKTHSKVILVVRQDHDGLRRYVHVGTGNYHTGTARLYEDLGVISCNDELGEDVAKLFNEQVADFFNGHCELAWLAVDVQFRLSGA